jgi:hypothetical protein
VTTRCPGVRVIIENIWQVCHTNKSSTGRADKVGGGEFALSRVAAIDKGECDRMKDSGTDVSSLWSGLINVGSNYEWEKAILKAFEMWRALEKHNGGSVRFDMTNQTVKFLD